MADEWYVQKDGQQFGPLSSDKLRKSAAAGFIISETLIRKGVDGKWVPAQKVKGLLPVQIVEQLKHRPQTSSQPSPSDQAGSNLAACPDCGNMVSKRAYACPSCGCPIGEQKVDSDHEYLQRLIDHEEHESSSGGVNFVTSHDLNDDGTPDFFVMHNTKEIARGIADLREGLGIPDDETQWRLIKKWGWIASAIFFVFGFGAGYVTLGEHEDGLFVAIFFGALLGGFMLLLTAAAHYIVED